MDDPKRGADPEDEVAGEIPGEAVGEEGPDEADALISAAEALTSGLRQVTAAPEGAVRNPEVLKKVLPELQVTLENILPALRHKADELELLDDPRAGRLFSLADGLEDQLLPPLCSLINRIK
ncbi:MAG: hypothetical protein K6A65_06970 [Succinivibrionaceae bacterium]|nr:hypothetical protein [Succinivibrionaceae bacterium]